MRLGSREVQMRKVLAIALAGAVMTSAAVSPAASAAILVPGR
jgi:hypothetical protein